MSSSVILGTNDLTEKLSVASPNSGEAFVIVDGRPGRQAIVLRAGERLTPAEARSRRARKVFRVDLHERSHSIEDGAVLDVEGLRSFAVRLDLTWVVADPIDAVLRGDFDIDRAIRIEINQLLSTLDRRFPMTPEGASALFGVVHEQLKFRTIAFTSVLRFTGRVDLDSEATEHFSALKKASEESLREAEKDKVRKAQERADLDERHRREAADAEHQARLQAEERAAQAQAAREKAALEAELARQRVDIDELRREQALADRAAEIREKTLEAEFERDRERQHRELMHKLDLQNLELDRQRLSQAAELEMTKRRQDLEITKMRADMELAITRERTRAELELFTDRLRIYAQLTGSDHDLITIQLANDPTKVDVVVANRLTQQRIVAQLQLDAVKALMEGDAVEGHQLEKIAERVMENFLGLTSAALSGGMHAPSAAAPAAEISAPQPIDPTPE